MSKQQTRSIGMIAGCTLTLGTLLGAWHGNNAGAVGNEYVAVPEVRGCEVDLAIELLESVELRGFVEGVNDGVVVRTVPEVDAPVAVDTAIELYTGISEPPVDLRCPYATVPDVVGQMVGDAVSRLATADLFAVIDFRADTELTVESQEPTAGAVVPRESEVQLRVAAPSTTTPATTATPTTEVVPGTESVVTTNLVPAAKPDVTVTTAPRPTAAPVVPSITSTGDVPVSSGPVSSGSSPDEPATTPSSTSAPLTSVTESSSPPPSSTSSIVVSGAVPQSGGKPISGSRVAVLIGAMAVLLISSGSLVRRSPAFQARHAPTATGTPARLMFTPRRPRHTATPTPPGVAVIIHRNAATGTINREATP